MSIINLPLPGRRSSTKRQRRGRSSPGRLSRAWAAIRTSAIFQPPTGRRSAEFVLILFLVMALCFIGLVMVLSASSVTGLQDAGSTWFYVKRQLLWSLVGVGALVLMMRIDYRSLAKAAPWGVGISVALLIAVLLPGVGLSANGSTRWLGYGPLTIQPSELAKLSVVVFSASLLSRRADRIHETRLTVRPILIVASLVAALVLVQPSLGTAMIIVAIAFSMLFLSGVPVFPLAVWTVGLGTVAAWLATTEAYRRDRLLAFLDPWEDPLNVGYQTIQSLVGIASGGLYGVGLGAGRSKWGFLPFAHTDFIFSVIAEELGLVGATFVIGMFVLLALFGIRVAMRAPDRFGTLLAAGITTWIVLQAFINIGAAVGVVPISGVPLPFVSLGGSSLVVSMLAMGIVLNIARQTRGRAGADNG